jgi:hypothetical protein
MILLFLPTFVSAQLVKIGAGGGLTQVLEPDYYTDDIGEAGFGFSTEWNAGIIVKVDLPLLPITPRGFFFYHSLAETGDLPGGSAETSQNIYEIGLGVQYNLISVPVGLDPYLALDLSYNSSSDLEKHYQGIEIGPTIIPGITGVGASVGLGTEVIIVPLINLDLCLSYKMFNLTGKEDGEETISAVTLDAFIIFNFL